MRSISSTSSAFAALDVTGSVRCWGDASSGGEAEEMHDVAEIFGNEAGDVRGSQHQDDNMWCYDEARGHLVTTQICKFSLLCAETRNDLEGLNVFILHVLDIFCQGFCRRRNAANWSNKILLADADSSCCIHVISVWIRQLDCRISDTAKETEWEDIGSSENAN